MKKQSKIIILVIALLSCFALCVFIYVFGYGSYVDTVQIIINNVGFENGVFHIKGDTTTSAKGYTGYNYRIENGNLIFKPRYAGLNIINKYGSFEVDIKVNKTIAKVLLEGEKKGDSKVIWP